MKMSAGFTKTALVLMLLLTSQVMSQAVELTADEIDRLDALGQSLEDATVAGEYNTLLASYTEDIIISPAFRGAIRGRKAVAKIYKENRESGLRYHSIDAVTEKRWRSGNQIFDYGAFGMAISQSVSQKPDAYHGSYFQIWEIQSDGSFKLSYTIWNLDFNPFQ
jgi:ketosteroid isomerase-like protein